MTGVVTVLVRGWLGGVWEGGGAGVVDEVAAVGR